MDIPINANVYCTDGLGGKTSAVIVDPEGDEVTHIVVKSNQRPHEQYLVPVQQITASDGGEIRLQCTCQGLAEEQRFIVTEYEQVTREREVAPAYQAYTFFLDQNYIPVKKRDVPPGELALSKGSIVMARDGRIGTVDEFIVDAQTDAITHLVIREQHLLGRESFTVPVSAVGEIGEDQVTLNLDRREVEQLSAGAGAGSLA